jgi:uncharacterized protein HemY
MQEQFHSIGKVLIIAGISFVIIGILLTQFDKIPLIGKMPGDILVKKKNFTFYFPLATSIVISIVLTLIFYLINKFRS